MKKFKTKIMVTTVLALSVASTSAYALGNCYDQVWCKYIPIFCLECDAL